MIHIFEKYGFQKEENGDLPFLYSKKMDEFLADDYQVNIRIPKPHIYKVHEEKNESEVILFYYYR